MWSPRGAKEEGAKANLGVGIQCYVSKIKKNTNNSILKALTVELKIEGWIVCLFGADCITWVLRARQ
ncbi:hypothetical protein BLOT_006555 [Blomia tropicalis]|nr:hypothetical protein BLOT_006555 [Blomia tropicalis]